MTAAAFAKLALRMWAAGMLFVYIPSKVMFGIMLIMPALLSGSVIDEYTLTVFGIFAVMIMACLIVWFQADRFALLLLPSGTCSEQGHDYAQWQRWGLAFFGGWSALMACLALENFIVEHFNIGYLFSMSFSLIVATFLIVGWDNLAGIFSRSAHKDTGTPKP